MEVDSGRKISTAAVALAGGILILIILVAGTIWMGQSAKKDTDEAVRTVSLLYLDELAGRREQVVENNLKDKVSKMQVAVDLMDDEVLSSPESLQSYQSRMKQLFNLEKFAFVDESGRIYTANGMEDNIDEYAFDYKTISEPEISIYNLESEEKKVIIAIPVDKMMGDVRLTVCFMSIDMREMLSGVSMETQNTDATFCNIYTNGGTALTNTVLGGLAVEDNLLGAMRNAEFESGYSYDKFYDEFSNCVRGQVSFTYDGIRETLSYVPISGTNWLLTYLIRESVISQKISPISNSIIVRSIVQTVLTILVLLGMFGCILSQIRKNEELRIRQERAEEANRVKQEEMEQRLLLQERLLTEERRRTQQDQMITAMASDYRVVYYVDLEHDDSVCYRADPEDTDQTPEGVHFPYRERFTWYAEHSVDESYREGFLSFIDPDNIRKGLEKEKILAYRYMAKRGGKEYYEMIRVAGVGDPSDEENANASVNAIGLGMTVIDAEMRKNMEQQKALSDALAAAEQANRAKTAFLSSMSHEIRTPMNAIIGLDNIALNDKETPEKTRDYLLRIGESAEHLLTLINDILDMSRIESGRMTLKNEEFSFQKLLESINTMFSSECQRNELEYQCHIYGDVDEYYIGDSMRIRQMLINILGNAVKFTPAGGNVSLSVKRMAQFDGKTTLKFIISDTGIGISPEYLPYLYDAFSQEDISTTSKYGSSGLGMAIVKNIVNMMNGNIEVESEKGKGTTFYVTITLSDVENSSAEGVYEDIRPSDMTVLIVDDDPVACEHARLVLEKAGIASEVAGSGPEAIEMVKLHHARRTPFNLILVDWQMPEMDGVETARQMRRIIGNETAIIILTAYRWDDVLEEALEAGIDSFLSKPLFAATVMEEFRSALIKRNAAAKTEKPRADLKGRRILLAEDMQVNADIMTMVLEMREMITEVAENGRIAVEMFAEHEEGYYDAVLMDMRMPEMDGLEATRTIRAMDRPDAKKIPIIALTANAFDEDVQRSLQAGLNAHLSKPVQPEALFETLEGLIED